MGGTDGQGKLLAHGYVDPNFKDRYDKVSLGYDFSSRIWFREPMKKGALHVTDIYQSVFTDKLILTVSAPIIDDKDEITGVIGADVQLEELLRRSEILEETDNER